MARLPDPGADRKAVHPRHHDIEDAEVWRLFLERVKKGLAIPEALHLVSLFFQEIFYQKTDVFFIIRHIDQLWHNFPPVFLLSARMRSLFRRLSAVCVPEF